MKIARVIDEQDRQLQVVRDKEGRLFRIESLPTGESRISEDLVTPKHWLPPVDPRAIYCIGANYRKHAEECGHELPKYPVVFMKNISAAIGHNESIRIPAVCDDEVDYEAELAIVIGKPCRNASVEQALEFVLGYSIANDVTARIWQTEKGGSQWCRAKGFDSFCPLGPFLTTTQDIENPNNLKIKTSLNGQIVQQDSTADMIFDVPTLISFLSQDTTLLPGTIILTGTPPGIGWARNPRRMLHEGDTVTIEIENLGTLSNTVAR